MDPWPCRSVAANSKSSWVMIFSCTQPQKLLTSALPVPIWRPPRPCGTRHSVAKEGNAGCEQCAHQGGELTCRLVCDGQRYLAKHSMTTLSPVHNQENHTYLFHSAQQTNHSHLSSPPWLIGMSSRMNRRASSPLACSPAILISPCSVMIPMLRSSRYGQHRAPLCRVPRQQGKFGTKKTVPPA